MLIVLGTSFLCLCCFACFSTLLQHEKFKIPLSPIKTLYENLLNNCPKSSHKGYPPWWAVALNRSWPSIMLILFVLLTYFALKIINFWLVQRAPLKNISQNLNLGFRVKMPQIAVGQNLRSFFLSSAVVPSLPAITWHESYHHTIFNWLGFNHVNLNWCCFFSPSARFQQLVAQNVGEPKLQSFGQTLLVQTGILGARQSGDLPVQQILQPDLVFAVHDIANVGDVRAQGSDSQAARSWRQVLHTGNVIVLEERLKEGHRLALAPIHRHAFHRPAGWAIRRVGKNHFLVAAGNLRQRVDLKVNHNPKEFATTCNLWKKSRPKAMRKGPFWCNTLCKCFSWIPANDFKKLTNMVPKQTRLEQQRWFDQTVEKTLFSPLVSLLIPTNARGFSLYAKTNGENHLYFLAWACWTRLRQPCAHTTLSCINLRVTVSNSTNSTCG